MLDKNVFTQSESFFKTCKQAKVFTECASGQCWLDLLVVGVFSSSVGLRLTGRLLSGRDASHFFPVEETAPMGSLLCKS